MLVSVHFNLGFQPQFDICYMFNILLKYLRICTRNIYLVETNVGPFHWDLESISK